LQNVQLSAEKLVLPLLQSHAPVSSNLLPVESIHGNVTSEEIKELYSALHTAGGNSLYYLLGLDKHFDNFAPKSMQLHGPLSSLCKPGYLNNMNLKCVRNITQCIPYSLNFTSALVNRLLSIQQIFSCLLSVRRYL